jgi:sarcosine oxidase subunit gamma
MAQIIRSPHFSQVRDSRDPDGITIHGLSRLGRTGFKGRGTSEWLATKVSILPERPNRAVTLADGAVVARLGQEEYLILNGRGSANDLSAELEASWASENASGVLRMGYPLPRADSHNWHFLEGPRVADMMTKLCGVDLGERSFPPGEVAQTIVARIGAVIIREIGTGADGIHLLTDVAYADYLREVLDDASAEYGSNFVPAFRR